MKIIGTALRKIEWNKVTWYSKIFAVIVFLAVFVVAFYLGRIYEVQKTSEMMQSLIDAARQDAGLSQPAVQ